ncbi:MAG: hypothetical protein QOE03_917 [Micromonosporaceae bacterium]|nr:hypothetical protein [Micromonosporaceae bacterium]
MGIFAEKKFATVAALFAAVVAIDPTRPLLTYYDDATAERTELSGATLDNWVAKTANMLVDGLGLGHGDRATVALPPHWQAAAVLLGCWSAGLSLSLADPTDPAGSAGSAQPAGSAESAGSARPAGSAQPAEVAFVAIDRLADAAGAGDRFVLGLAPMALPLRDVPAGYTDFVAEVRGHGDRFRPSTPIGGTDPALTDGTDHDRLYAAALDAAERLALSPTDRVLVDAARVDGPLDWLLAPLAAGASIVLCANSDPAALAARQASERVTRTLT